MNPCLIVIQLQFSYIASVKENTFWVLIEIKIKDKLTSIFPTVNVLCPDMTFTLQIDIHWKKKITFEFVIYGYLFYNHVTVKAHKYLVENICQQSKVYKINMIEITRVILFFFGNHSQQVNFLIFTGQYFLCESKSLKCFLFVYITLYSVICNRM